MCGIVAAFSSTQNFNQSLLVDMMNKISHRGKDERGFYLDHGVALGHNRLSIVGNKGQQPLFNKEQDVFAVVNGEFYGYKKIREKLINEGFSFRTETDSEIVVPLYQMFSTTKDFFEKLNGEFAAIIYDKRNHKVIAFRDRFGVNPLYYYKKENHIYFASEQKAFLPVSKMNWDQTSLNSVLTMQYHSSDSTLLKDVKQVQAGTFIEIDLKTMDVKEFRYWDMNYQPDDSMSFDDAKENLRKALSDSVQDRISVDRKKGITLSGGIDSSVIWALANQQSDKPLDAYSISFANGKNYDEFKIAEEMCSMYKGTFNPIIVDEMDMLQNIESATYHSEEVSINSHLSAKYILFREMAQAGVKVSLSGEGSDELLLGYPHLKLDIDNSEENIVKNAYLSGIQTPDGQSLGLDGIIKELGFAPKFLEAKYSMGYKLQNDILSESFVQNMYDPIKDILKPLRLPKMDNVYTSTYLWSKICLGNYILVGLGDKMEMASTIEGRVPFLDKRVYEAVRQMPTNFKMNGSIEKYILKETFKNDITPSIYTKQKHPFVSPPLLSWGGKNDSVMVRLMDILNSQQMKNNSFFDVEKIKRLLVKLENESIEVKTKYDPIIMLILTLYYFEKNMIQ